MQFTEPGEEGHNRQIAWGPAGFTPGAAMSGRRRAALGGPDAGGAGGVAMAEPTLVDLKRGGSDLAPGQGRQARPERSSTVDEDGDRDRSGPVSPFDSSSIGGSAVSR